MKAQHFLSFLGGALLLFFPSQLLAQAGPDDVTPAKLEAFWNDNVTAIIKLDRKKIIEQTYFPLEGEWFVVFDMWESTEEELQEAYKERMEEIFDQELRDLLAENTAEILSVEEYEEDTILSLPLFFDVEVDGDIYESTVILEFRMIAEKWMLTAIHYAG